MKKVTTKHGHEWLCPEAVGEFQAAGVNLDRLCGYAGQYLRKMMSMRSAHAAREGKPFNPSLGYLRRPRISADEKVKNRVSKITKKLTPELRAALLAELTKEPTNG